MDEIAEKGIASHWSYKEKGSVKIQSMMEQKQRQVLFIFRTVRSRQKKAWSGCISTERQLRLPRWWRFRALLHHATLCERAGLFDQALRDYEEVLAMQPATGKAPGKAEWHILYSAGSGGVMQLFYLKRYADAADMADRIAAWNKAEAEPAKHKQVADWAAFIRQTNFVSESAMPF